MALAGPWAFLASGQGWRGAGPIVDAAPWGVPQQAVVETLRLRLRGDGGEDDRRAALAALAQLQGFARRGLAVAGYIGFELGAALEAIAVAGARGAPADLGGAPVAPALRDRAEVRAAAPGPGVFDGLDDLYVVAFAPQALQRPAPVSGHCATDGTSAATDASDLTQQTDHCDPAWQALRPGFLRDVAEVKAEVADGRLYQVNVTRALPLRPAQSLAVIDADPLMILTSLQAQQAVPLAAVVALSSPGQPETRLVCGSMELFLALDRDRAGATTLRSRPIKGTCARGRCPESDAQARDRLLASSKERAENAMIVDMARNDLGRVATVGTVEVPTLLLPVAYATLWHLESEVRATLAPGRGVAAALAATLPPASVSGAPKVAAIAAIVRLEGRRRGPYCGAIGVLWPDGSCRLAVGIRLVAAQGERGELAVGAGIVADSNAEAEWRELLLKAQSSLRWIARCTSESADLSAARTTNPPADVGVSRRGP